MSLSKWKELAQRKKEAGKAVNQFYDEITEEKIRSKTTDQAIANSFRLDKLDQIAEQTKPKQRRWVPRPRIYPDRGIDYAPEVDPYEDIDVEGLLNLEDFVPPQAEKQIAKPKKLPEYEMDPSFWQTPGDPPPEYSEIFHDDEGEEDEREANKILDHLELPNHDDVEKRLAEPEMTATRQRNYLDSVLKNADKRQRQVTAMKSNAKKFNKGIITEAERKKIHDQSDKFRKENNSKFKSKSVKGCGVKRGRGVYFYHKTKELLEKLIVIIGEMEAGNTSIDMRNMGQTILDILLKNKSMNKSQYQK